MIKLFRKRANKSPAKPQSGEIDFSSMSKEEIAAYYERKMQLQAENQTKIIQNLRGELTRSNEKLQNKENALNQSKELDGILTGSSGFGSDWGSSATGGSRFNSGFSTDIT